MAVMKGRTVLPAPASSPRRPAPVRRTPQRTVQVRAVRRTDLEAVIALDASVTGLEKRSYWERVYRRYGCARKVEQRWFIVALLEGRVAGFMIGEVRDWEFGSPPCGWVFAIDVDPAARQQGVGTRLLDEAKTRFARDGVTRLRTLLHRDNVLILSFFRSQGLMAGPLIPLECELPTGAAR
jgi:ribosomal protein S18 acetylase RimI-like enzyme